MKHRWEALNARVRGLATHLLDDDRLAALEDAADPAELAQLLRPTPYARFLPLGDFSYDAVDTAVTRSLADRVAGLARWGDPDSGVLEPILLELDAQSVRSIIRGIIGGLALELKLSGTIPTPMLVKKALERLARSTSPGAVAATLVAWGHPLGLALLPEARRKHPNPFRLETALALRLAEAASQAVRGHGRLLRTYAAEGVDAGNIVTALLLAGARSESRPAELFVPGGAALSAGDFERAASEADRPRSARQLERALRRTVFAAVLREGPASPQSVSARIQVARIDRLRRWGRTDPLSPAPVLLFVLLLRREARLVRRALYRTRLHRMRLNGSVVT